MSKIYESLKMTMLKTNEDHSVLEDMDVSEYFSTTNPLDELRKVTMGGFQFTLGAKKRRGRTKHGFMDRVTLTPTGRDMAKMVKSMKYELPIKSKDTIMESLDEGRYFITDMGKSAKVTDSKGKHVTTLGRYGVWDTSGRKPQVVDQGNDLKALMKKYDVSEEVVHKLRESLEEAWSTFQLKRWWNSMDRNQRDDVLDDLNLYRLHRDLGWHQLPSNVKNKLRNYKGQYASWIGKPGKIKTMRSSPFGKYKKGRRESKEYRITADIASCSLKGSSVLEILLGAPVKDEWWFATRLVVHHEDQVIFLLRRPGFDVRLCGWGAVANSLQYVE